MLSQLYHMTFHKDGCGKIPSIPDNTLLIEHTFPSIFIEDSTGATTKPVHF